MNAPIIVTALIGPEDFARLDRMRRAHYPADRNFVPAHITLFHHLPPSLMREIKQRLATEAAAAPPEAWLARLDLLEQGVAYRIESPELEAIRERLADAFMGILTPQDQAPWRPHVTIQNKVKHREAKALHRRLSSEFERCRLTIAGLASWIYRGGPWEPLSRHPFRG